MMRKNKIKIFKSFTSNKSREKLLQKLHSCHQTFMQKYFLFFRHWLENKLIYLAFVYIATSQAGSFSNVRKNTPLPFPF